MPSMRRYPRDRTAFHPEHAEHGDRVVEPARDAQALVREHAMEAEREADAAGEIAQNDRDRDARPAERGRDQREQRPQVQDKQACLLYTSGTYDPSVIGRAESRTFVTFGAMLLALAFKARKR